MPIVTIVEKSELKYFYPILALKKSELNKCLYALRYMSLIAGKRQNLSLLINQ